jgi:hypothetical protein
MKENNKKLEVGYYLFFGYYFIAGANNSPKFKTVKELKEYVKSKTKQPIEFKRFDYK